MYICILLAYKQWRIVLSLSQELGFPNALRNRDHEALLNILHTAELLKKESQKLFKPLGITGAQFNVLILLLAQTPNGAMNQSELGRMLTVNRSNITGLTDRLEKQGLVRREPDAVDRRVNNVRLTGRGTAIARKAQSLYIERIHEIMGGLEQDDWESLSAMLTVVRQGLDQ